MIGLVHPLERASHCGCLTSKAHGQPSVVSLWVRHQTLVGPGTQIDLVGWYYLMKVKETLQVSEISSAMEKFKTKRISQ